MSTRKDKSEFQNSNQRVSSIKTKDLPISKKGSRTRVSTHYIKSEKKIPNQSAYQNKTSENKKQIPFYSDKIKSPLHSTAKKEEESGNIETEEKFKKKGNLTEKNKEENESNGSDNESFVIQDEDVDEDITIRESLKKTSTLDNLISDTKIEDVHSIINPFPKLSSNPFLENNKDKKGKEQTNNSCDKKNEKNSSKKVTQSISKENKVLYMNLLLYARKGDKDSFIETVKKILKNKGDLNYKDERGFSALHYACDEGNLKIVDILIKASVDLNIKTMDKKTPLHFASINGYFDISKLLVESGASLDSFDNEKNTPLHFCALNGHVELLKFFLEQLPNAEIKNIYEKTPLDYAKTEEIKNIISEYIYKKGSLTQNDNSTSENNSESTKKSEFTSNKTRPHTERRGSNIVNKCAFNNLEKLNNSEKAKINIELSPDNRSKNTNIFDLYKAHNTVLKNDLLKKNYPLSTKNANSKSKDLDYNYREKSSKNFNLNYTCAPPPTKKYNCLQQILNKNKPKLNTNSNYNASPSLNKSHNKIMTNNIFPKKLTVNGGKTNLTNTNKKKLSEHSSVKNTQNVKRTKALQKFITHNNFKVKNKKLEKDKEEEESNQNKEINNNLTLEQKEKLCKRIDQSKSNYSLHPTDSKLNGDNLLSDINLNPIKEEKIELTNFSCLGILGKGSFGDVFLVQKNDTKQQYAMKILSKDKVMSQNLLRYVMAERNVLSLTNHPFIVKLYFSFQTYHKLFLILEYCNLGDLGKHLRKEKKFTEERAKFYLCEILLALEDLHKRGIIFRDLKPDNVVLDEEGHAKLTDFGLSKEGVYDSNSAKSFCGSIAYLAPEMIKKQGHGKAVDWYLLGVLFYEMLTGFPPYYIEQK
ncbi:MAG: protein kinase [archaeon]|nr:protein kinase [archaeon]